jgi:hypothetical protein
VATLEELLEGASLERASARSPMPEQIPEPPVERHFARGEHFASYVVLRGQLVAIEASHFI